MHKLSLILPVKCVLIIRKRSSCDSAEQEETGDKKRKTEQGVVPAQIPAGGSAAVTSSSSSSSAAAAAAEAGAAQDAVVAQVQLQAQPPAGSGAPVAVATIELPYSYYRRINGVWTLIEDRVVNVPADCTSSAAVRWIKNQEGITVHPKMFDPQDIFVPHAETKRGEDGRVTTGGKDFPKKGTLEGVIFGRNKKVAVYHVPLPIMGVM